MGICERFLFSLAHFQPPAVCVLGASSSRRRNMGIRPVAMAVLMNLCLTIGSSFDAQASSRCRLLDFNTTSHNLLFGGAMPHQFDYDALVESMRRCAAEAGQIFPSSFSLRVFALDRTFRGDSFAQEQEWFRDRKKRDQYTRWAFAEETMRPPSDFPSDAWVSMAQNYSLWRSDALPPRIEHLHALLNSNIGKPLVIYVHCTGGCDLTSEVSGAYMMRYKQLSTAEMYAQTRCSTGKFPNRHVTSALEWYCLRLGRSHDECTSFATCTSFDDCRPTNHSLSKERTSMVSGVRYCDCTCANPWTGQAVCCNNGDLCA